MRNTRRGNRCLHVTQGVLICAVPESGGTVLDVNGKHKQEGTVALESRCGTVPHLRRSQVSESLGRSQEAPLLGQQGKALLNPTGFQVLCCLSPENVLSVRFGDRVGGGRHTFLQTALFWCPRLEFLSFLCLQYWGPFQCGFLFV